MGNFKITCREQLLTAAVAIHDWATGIEERQGIDWTQYDRITVAQVFAPVAIIGLDNERVANMHREFWRKTTMRSSGRHGPYERPHVRALLPPHAPASQEQFLGERHARSSASTWRRWRIS